MKNNFNSFLETLAINNCSLHEIVDFEKINLNVEKIRMHLNALNYIIVNDQKTFIINVKVLFEHNKECFQVIPLLAAKRIDFKNFAKQFFIKEEVNVDDILSFFIETNLMEQITSGKIRNFVDYYFGVEVGLDSNSRKNRTGKKVEKEIELYLRNYFIAKSEIKVFVQKGLNDLKEIGNSTVPSSLKTKRFDFLIVNEKNCKVLFIESSFYNAGGSKINETNRSFLEIFNLIKNYSEHWKFLWVADGQGIKTIKKNIEQNFNLGYVTNFFFLKEHLKWIE